MAEVFVGSVRPINMSRAISIAFARFVPIADYWHNGVSWVSQPVPSAALTPIPGCDLQPSAKPAPDLRQHDSIPLKDWRAKVERTWDIFRID